METIQELLTEEIRDLYDAEKQLLRALPKFSKAANHDELKALFNEHLEVTRGQVERLEQVFELLGERPKGKPCRAMKGLIEEGQEVLQEGGEETLLDEAMIGAAQKVEHYEIAGYGTARTLAQTLGMKDAAKLLQQTLDEEGAADKKLTAVALRLMKEAGRQSAAGRGTSTGRSTGDGRSVQAARGRNGGARTQRGSKAVTTTDHDEIRRWAEERNAAPSCVRGTGRRGDTGMLRFDFPGYTGAESLQHIGWDEFFEKFDEQHLALLYQPQTASGQKSNFNKLVSMETTETAKRPPRKSAGRSGNSARSR